MAVSTNSCPPSDPNSKVARHNIPQTCGACHGQKFVMASSGVSSAPFASYQESVHGKAVAAGSEKAAVCTDCHGAHDILAADDPKSPIAKLNVPATCGKCHNNIKQEFVQSIHGQAIARGNWAAPVCTDCHGIHTIKAPNDPKSAVASANVENTCASCHGSVKLSIGVRRRWRTRQLVPVQLSRHGIKNGFQHRGQLRQLPQCS